MEIYEIPIYIVVQSKYPEVLATFKETFYPTTEKFKKLTLIVEDGKEYGAGVINKHINIARANGNFYFGVFNDDIWFSEGWLETVIPFFDKHWIVSAGYVETTDREKFNKAVELTKNEEGYVKHLYGPNAIFNMEIFKKIGIFDERFDWTCDDLDWALRTERSGLSTITLKRITCAHFRGKTMSQNLSNWYRVSEINKQRFYDKNGYVSYRHIRAEYKLYHQYFVQFK
jgi:GT2 family glycosyltransferase